MKKERVLFNWSGGKDSALALYMLAQENQYEIDSLLTTVNRDYQRISMHGIRETLLQQQQINMGFPLEKVYLSQRSSNEEYNSQMEQTLHYFKSKGISKAVFGDIFLEDIRRYREDQLSKINMQALFPLWGKDTAELARYFLSVGFRAIVTCVDTSQVPKELAGEEYSREFISSLPDSADPCGENGEFHTLVYDGPVFKKPISIKKGEKVLRDNRFYFCDILPG